ncbi:MAG: DUF3179 domain-containing protein [Gemmatimonadota bacterium]|nr:DUF3179 domain-containing protein [Gemmatimonadota bacterium]
MPSIARFSYGFQLALLLLCVSNCGEETPVDSADESEGPGGQTFRTVLQDNAGRSADSSRVAAVEFTGRNFLNPLTFPHDRVESIYEKDATRALIDPRFVPAASAEARYLSDDDMVIGVRLNGISKAYPQKVAWYHLIVNDRIGGQPIAVTFSPLTGSGIVFAAWSGGAINRLKFGASGELFNNNLIMYDLNDDQIRYPQMTHTGISGVRAGWVLNTPPFVETTWRYWKQLYPDTFVISSNTPGAFDASEYNVYPYGMYRDPESAPKFQVFPRLEDNPLAGLFAPKEMTFGVRFIEEPKAYPASALGDEAVINDILAGRNIVVVWYGAERMAVAFSRDYGQQTLVFDRVPSSSRTYPFMLRDRETLTTWDLKGRAIAGPLKESVLQQIPGHSAFWFAWITFWQDTEVYGE